MDLNFMKKASLTLILLMLAVGCDSAKVDKAKDKSIFVSSALVEVQSMSTPIKLVGTLVAKESVIIASEVDGRVAEIKVTDSQQVQKGDLLFTLIDRQAKAELEEAQAYLKDESRKLKEFKQLGAKGGVSATIRESQQVSVDIAQARMNAAKVNYDYHRILAPISGVLGLVNITQGQRLIKDTPVMTLDNTALMQLDLNIPEKYISKLAKGQTITTKVSAWGEDVFEGKVAAIDSRVQPQSLDIKIRVGITNVDRKLKPGMLAHAKLKFPASSYTVVPLQAIEYAGEKTFVYVIDENWRAHQTEVVLGEQIAEQVVVSEGLASGQRIVIEGLVNISDKDVVKEAPAFSREAAQ
ncbi:efflux transporter periplasmic adaptor subunit [Shewanella sp. GutDb-MelDb]|nr:efflux transporter periplasmic adaptor subunit [Shewanella sp. GutDb-MelDb]